MKKLLIFALALGLSLSLAGCASETKTTLHISAAASLTDVLTQLAQEYKTAQPHVELVFTFDSSGTLKTQIEEGAPADLFLSAAQKQMDALEDESLIDPETRIDLLENKVVLITPADTASSFVLERFEDAADPAVKTVAVGESSVPVGQYTKEIYTTLGLWDEISAKAVFGTNVRAVLTWVENGEADCGVVYATDAATTNRVKVVCQAPEGSHAPVVYPAAVLKNAEHADQARDFLAFLQSDTAVAAFTAAGFTMAGE